VSPTRWRPDIGFGVSPFTNRVTRVTSLMPIILALDQGTTGSTALVFGEGGQLLGRGYREIPQFFPAPGEVEHDPLSLLESIVAAGREAIERAGVTPDAIGITNQRETVVIWDRVTLEPVGRAIVWQDRRTAPRCAELRRAGEEEAIRAKTGLLLDPYFSATKLEWLLEDTEVSARAEDGSLVAGTVESWLVAMLSGGTHVTDRSNSSRTLLANLATGEWDDDLLRLFGVPRRMLPRVVDCVGEHAVASAAWFGREMPITGLVGDQQAALFGQGCVHPGEAKVTFGTGAFLLRYTGAEAPPVPGDGILATIAASPTGGLAWALEGSVFIAGAAVQWLRDGLGIIAGAEETAAMAGNVSDTAGVSFVPAFAGLGAPYWDPDARGTIVGLTRGTQRAHLVRATLEAIANSTADLVVAMGGVSELRVDGGAASNDWLMQYQADLLDVPVLRPAGVELTGYGAARLAALGLGHQLPPAPDLGAMTVFEPARDGAWRDGQRDRWRVAVEAAVAWAEAGRRTT
jgi:glycerol kinase